MSDPNLYAEIYERNRSELVSYTTRLVVRHEVAEELVQETAVRLMEQRRVPDEQGQVRAWMFRVVTNLAIDYLRRHSTWRELILIDARTLAEHDEQFVAQSAGLRGSHEVAAIAREHLAVCVACTLRNLPPQQAAALLLKEVHGFSATEVAAATRGTANQVKNWIQLARRALQDRYGRTCALVAKEGVCHQCVELDGFFNGVRRDPLEGSARDVNARLAVLRETRHRELGPWHKRLLKTLDALLS